MAHWHKLAPIEIISWVSVSGYRSNTAGHSELPSSMLHTIYWVIERFSGFQPWATWPLDDTNITVIEKAWNRSPPRFPARHQKVQDDCTESYLVYKYVWFQDKLLTLHFWTRMIPTMHKTRILTWRLSSNGRCRHVADSQGFWTTMFWRLWLVALSRRGPWRVKGVKGVGVGRWLMATARVAKAPFLVLWLYYVCMCFSPLFVYNMLHSTF